MEEKENRSLSVWDPVAELAPFGRWPGRPSRLLEEFWGPAARGFAPAIDVVESDGQYVVTAELPGTKKNDVTVELHEGRLTIRGEKRSEREEQKGEQRRHVERAFGSFSRSFTLPPDADGDQIKAKFDDGVLTVEIPKTERAKPQTVDIKG